MLTLESNARSVLRIRPIDSLELPELAPYRTMRRVQEQRDEGIFVAEGEKVVRRLLESHFTVLSVLMPEHWMTQFTPILQNRPEAIQGFVADKALLETLIGFSMYQGVLAVGQVPSAPSLEDLWKRAPSPRYWTAMDGLTNGENVGVVVRNAAAFGVQTIVSGETSSSPFLRRSIRSSMGTIFRLPVLETQNLAATLQELRRRGLHIVGAHPHSDKRILSQAQLRQDLCLVFGSEGEGISPAVQNACDELVAIPMAPGVDSLNVGCASAAFFYEVARQRGMS